MQNPGLVTNVLTHNNFCRVTSNLKVDKARVRHDSMEGRDYLVVPCVMLTEGVHAGSQGPLYYPADELAKTPAVWNSKPVVVYHPKENGASISACDPVVFTKQKIGLLMNTRFDGGALKTDCWLEEGKTREVDKRVLEAVENEKVMEVSTGLFTDYEAIDGEWNGKKYSAIARNYRPDHLAVLPDQTGACSVEDGAGLLRNATRESGPAALLAASLVATFNELSHSDIWQKLNGKIRPSVPDGEVSIDAWVNEVWDDFFIYEKGGKTWYQEYSVKDDEVSLDGVRKEAARATSYKLSDGTIVGNAFTKTEGGNDYPASAYAYVPDSQKPSTWKLRLWETPTKKTTAAQVGRAIAAIGKGFRGNRVQLPASAVKRVKSKIRAAWRKTHPGEGAEDMPTVIRNEEGVMDKKQLVDGLIGNEKSPWTEDDREMLMGLSEEQLGSVVGNATPAGETPPAVPPPAPPAGQTAPAAAPAAQAPAAPATPAANQVTVDEFIANAPEGLRDVLRSGVNSHNAEKATLVAKITANKRNTFSTELLNAKGLDELKALALLAEVPVPTSSNAPSYVGLGEPAPVNNEGEPKEEPLTMAAMDFGQSQGNK